MQVSYSVVALFYMFQIEDLDINDWKQNTLGFDMCPRLLRGICHRILIKKKFDFQRLITTRILLLLICLKRNLKQCFRFDYLNYWTIQHKYSQATIDTSRENVRVLWNYREHYSVPLRKQTQDNMNSFRRMRLKKSHTKILWTRALLSWNALGLWTSYRLKDGILRMVLP